MLQKKNQSVRKCETLVQTRRTWLDLNDSLTFLTAKENLRFTRVSTVCWVLLKTPPRLSLVECFLLFLFFLLNSATGAVDEGFDSPVGCTELFLCTWRGCV